jgi:hypothetical protein
MCDISFTVVNRVQRYRADNWIFVVVMEAVNFICAGGSRPALGPKQIILMGAVRLTTQVRRPVPVFNYSPPKYVTTVPYTFMMRCLINL